MSAKNTASMKRVRRMERALRKGRLPKFINLIHYLEDRGEADTASAARKLILAKRVVSESHPLGIHTIKQRDDKDEVVSSRDIVVPDVPASLRPTIRVLPA